MPSTRFRVTLPARTAALVAALAAALASAVVATAARAAEPPAMIVLPPPPAPAASAAASAPVGNPTEKRVIEDDRVRIEETRLRGQTQTVTVTSKLPGVRPYEVIMPPLGKDPSQDKGAAGKRTWSLFDF